MMHFLKRPLVLVILGLIIIAAVSGVAFQYSSAKTLELAEALEFRRMRVAQQQDPATYRFFYITNRQSVDGGENDDGAADYFTNDREPGLKLGYFDTGIEPSLGIGMLINPSDWFQNEEIQLKAVTPTPKDEFIRQLRGQVDSSPDRSLLININGFRERFSSALRKTAFLAHVLDMNTPLLDGFNFHPSQVK